VTSAWIPAPAAGSAVAVFVVILAVHLRHLAVKGGRRRTWHAGHVLMALGMIVMFLPTGHRMVVSSTLGVGFFTGAAVLLAGALLVAKARGTTLGPLWLLSVVDLAAMAFMFATMSTSVTWLSVLAAVWFVGQAFGWAGGWLGRVLDHRGLGEPVPAIRDPLGSGTATASKMASPTPGRATQTVATGARAATTNAAPPATSPRFPAAADSGTASVVDGGTGDWSVRITLTMMSLGMAYMFLATSFGMPAMGAGAGMPEMGS